MPVCSTACLTNCVHLSSFLSFLSLFFSSPDTGVTDFTAASHTVTFANSDVTGESTRQTCIDFPVLDDDILEIDETFEIHIDMQQSGDSVPVTILPHTTIVTIMDDDRK